MPLNSCLLVDCGAPPLLGYALACSLAWHTRRPTLFLVVGETHAAELRALLAGMSSRTAQVDGNRPASDATVTWEPPGRDGKRSVGAHMTLASPAAIFHTVDLPATLDRFATGYAYLLLQVTQETGETVSQTSNFPALRLIGSRKVGRQSAHAMYKQTLHAWSDDGSGMALPDNGGDVHVPALNAEDEDALAHGELPATTPAGKVLGWVARRIARLSVGLALGAGSEKGYAHLGVLRVLQRVGVQPDFVAGTSIGSGVAALIALGRNLDEIREVVDKVGSATFRPTLPTSGFLSNAGLKSGLRAVFGEARFEELLLPLGVVAADLLSGREVVFEHGLLWPALLASMSIPGVFPAVAMGEYALVDGGIVNPVPSNVVAGLGADVVIAVKLAVPVAIPVLGAAAIEGKGRPPSVFRAIPRSIEMMQSKIFGEAASRATILIEPLFTSSAMVGLGLRRFTAGRSYEALGEQAAEAALSRIAGALPWTRKAG